MVAICLLVSAAVGAQDTEVVGVVEVVQTDGFETSESELHYWIIDRSSGKAYKTRFNGNSDKRPDTGAVIRAKGKFDGEEFVVSTSAQTGEPTYQLLEAAPAPSTAHSIAVIIVDFQDALVTCSAENIAQSMFPRTGNSNVSEYYIESSNGEFGFLSDADTDGFLDVFGPYRISASINDACDYYSWGYEAEDLATADGVDLSTFKHLLFVIPSSTKCTWAGVANVGCGTQCRSWVARCSMNDLYAHELGHNLGMRHASSDTNNDGSVDSEYGDNSDVMGYSNVGWRHPNAPHKEQMGWFSAYPNRIQTITTSGTYTIDPLDLYPWEVDSPQILKIYKPDSSEYYYLSYRLKVGYSSTLRAAYAEKVNVHRYKGSGSTATKFISALLDGGQFRDTVLGLTVTQLNHNIDPANGYATVSVSFGAAPAAPTLTISPSSQKTTALGALTYAVSVRNNDDVQLGATSFSMSNAAPAGWSTQWSNTTISLLPGQTGTSYLTVTPASAALDGTYAINVLVESLDQSHPDSSGTLYYVLDASPPQPVNDLAGSQDRRGVVQLSWTASRDGTGYATSYRVYRDQGSGFALIGQPTSASFSDSATSVTVSTEFRYRVEATDASGHVSAPGNIASIVVKGGSKSNGKGGRPR